MATPIFDVIEKYISLVRKPTFYEYEEEMILSIQKAIEDSYKSYLSEPKMVEKVTLSFRKQKKFFDEFSIFTNAVYIHGNPSMVEFEYPQSGRVGELGDLIFIISVVYGKKKCFERYTISQCKKSSDDGPEPRWRVDNFKRLYLLSRFPAFRGAPGSLIPGSYYTLHNYTRCLGSYVLCGPPHESFS